MHRVCALLVSFFALFAFTPAFALVDALDDPSPRSERAQHGLLLDITRTGERLTAIGERGHIIYSDDQGERWLQADVPVRVTLTAISSPTPRHSWAVGHDGVILASRNGGQSWQKQLDGYQANQLIIAELKRLRALSADQRVQQGILYQQEELDYLLEDAELFIDEGASRPFLDVLFINDRIGIAVGAFGMIFRTQNGGQDWQPKLTHFYNPDNYHLNALVSSNGALFITGEAGVLFRSLDAGQRWSTVTSPYDGPLFGMITHDAPGSAGLVVFGLRGHAFLSADHGASWTRLSVNSDAALLGAVVRSRSEFVLLASDGTIFRFNLQGDLLGWHSSHERGALSSAVATTYDDLLLVGASGLTRIHLPSEQLESP